jgi:hypothetical protein
MTQIPPIISGAHNFSYFSLNGKKRIKEWKVSDFRSLSFETINLTPFLLKVLKEILTFVASLRKDMKNSLLNFREVLLFTPA